MVVFIVITQCCILDYIPTLLSYYPSYRLNLITYPVFNPQFYSLTHQQGRHVVVSMHGCDMKARTTFFVYNVNLRIDEEVSALCFTLTTLLNIINKINSLLPKVESSLSSLRYSRDLQEHRYKTKKKS